MPHLKTSGGVTATIQLTDPATGDALQLELSLVDDDAIVIQPNAGWNHRVAATVSYTNQSVQVEICDAADRRFSVTLWDRYGHTHGATRAVQVATDT